MKMTVVTAPKQARKAAVLPTGEVISHAAKATSSEVGLHIIPRVGCDHSKGKQDGSQWAHYETPSPIPADPRRGGALKDNLVSRARVGAEPPVLGYHMLTPAPYSKLR